MLEVIQTARFKKHLKKYRYHKAVLAELTIVVEQLITEKPLPQHYKNHKLTGNYSGMLEIHLKPDCLLIYLKNEHSITLVALGSHAELFR